MILTGRLNGGGVRKPFIIVTGWVSANAELREDDGRKTKVGRRENEGCRAGARGDDGWGA